MDSVSIFHCCHSLCCCCRALIVQLNWKKLPIIQVDVQRLCVLHRTQPPDPGGPSYNRLDRVCQRLCNATERWEHDADQNMVDYSIVQSWEPTSVRMCVVVCVCVCVHGCTDSFSSADPCPAFNSTNPVEQFVSFRLTPACHPLPLAFVSYQRYSNTAQGSRGDKFPY